eukprot:5592613-Prymnesium_polylepis.1
MEARRDADRVFFTPCGLVSRARTPAPHTSVLTRLRPRAPRSPRPPRPGSAPPRALRLAPLPHA